MLTVSQRRTKILLEHLLGSEDFEADITLYRQQIGNIYAWSKHSQKLVKKYKIPLNALPVLTRYVHHNEIDFSLISPPAYIIGEDGHYPLGNSTLETAAITLREELDDSKKRFINLLISPNATQAEIKEFVSLNWDLIKQEQQRILGEEQKRLRERPQHERDVKVVELLKTGQTIVQIQKALNEDTTIQGVYEAADVRKIVSTIRQRQQTERDV